jgi:hypothetical protein
MEADPAHFKVRPNSECRPQAAFVAAVLPKRISAC